MTTADAVDRETAWLQTSGDGLPSLLTTAGGPFDLIQAYQPRTQRTKQRSIYVLRRGLLDDRFSVARRHEAHELILRIRWPLLTGTGAAEVEQRNLDKAIELVLQRVRGPLQDKTHGGQFLSAAENPSQIQVVWADPAKTIDLGYLEVEVMYRADDSEVIV